MLQDLQQNRESEQMTETVDKLLLDVLKSLVYESHEEHVDYGEEMSHGKRGTQQHSGDSGGGSMLSLLLVGLGFAAVGYMMGKRSGSSGKMGGKGSQRIEGVTDKAANRTQEMAEKTAETVREGGQQLSERADETADQAADQIEEGGKQAGDQIEKGGSEAADKMDDSS